MELTDVVRVKRLELFDKQDRMRALLATSNEADSPYLTLLDANGLERIGLALDVHGFPCIRLLHQSGSSYAGIRISPDGHTLLTLSRPDGTVAIKVVLGTDNETNVDILDEKGRSVWSCND